MAEKTEPTQAPNAPKPAVSSLRSLPRAAGMQQDLVAMLGKRQVQAEAAPEPTASQPEHPALVGLLAQAGTSCTGRRAQGGQDACRLAAGCRRLLLDRPPGSTHSQQCKRARSGAGVQSQVRLWQGKSSRAELRWRPSSAPAGGVTGSAERTQQRCAAWQAAVATSEPVQPL